MTSHDKPVTSPDQATITKDKPMPIGNAFMPLCRRASNACRVVAACAMLALGTPALAEGDGEGVGCPPAWVPGIGSLGLSGRANALAALPGGDVIVGGSFTTAGGVPARNIARYSPTTGGGGVWSALGSGIDNPVYALAVMPDGDVIAAGDFTTAGGVSAHNIARYSQTSEGGGVWSALGSGINNDVFALAVLPGGDVIAGGAFSTAGGVATRRIARYTPSTGGGGVWSAMGAGAANTVHALAVLPSGDLVVGGAFTTAGGVAANRIARYDANSGAWSALGAGTDNNVLEIAVLPDGNVIVGGTFGRAGDVEASRIAHYNPTTGNWSALGTGIDGVVSALAALPGGDVIVGGAFLTAGGVPARYLARYNPTTDEWSALGTGTNSGVLALAVLPGGDVVVGGNFSTAGDVLARGIARYHPGEPAPSITTQPAPQSTCPSGTGSFTVAASGTDPFTYQWRKGGTPIDTAVNPSAGTATLTLTHVQPADAGSYDCVVTTPCGGVTSNPATLTICTADFNCSGFVDCFDYEAFVGCFENQACGEGSADFNGDGFVDFFDYADFVEAYETGC